MYLADELSGLQSYETLGIKTLFARKKGKLLLPIVEPEMSALCTPGSSRTRATVPDRAQRGVRRGGSPPRLVLLICGNYSDRLSLFILPHQELTCVNLPFIATKGDAILLLHAWITHFPQPRCLFQNLWRLAHARWGLGGNLKSFIFWATEKSLSLNNANLTNNRDWWISRGIWKMLQWGCNSQMSISYSSSRNLLRVHLEEIYLSSFSWSKYKVLVTNTIQKNF